jgi:hypothetical protein
MDLIGGDAKLRLCKLSALFLLCRADVLTLSTATCSDFLFTKIQVNSILNTP